MEAPKILFQASSILHPREFFLDLEIHPWILLPHILQSKIMIDERDWKDSDQIKII